MHELVFKTDQPKSCRPQHRSLSRKLATTRSPMISGTASRSIIGWSDRLFRPNHPVSRDDASMPDIPVLAMNSTTIRTQLVRILHLHYKTTCFPWKNEGLEATLATHRTIHQGARQRTRRRSTCRHGHAWIGRKAKAIGQKCKKPWENQGFLAERTGTELFDVIPMFFLEVRTAHFR
jgi:hypothetical protein